MRLVSGRQSVLGLFVICQTWIGMAYSGEMLDAAKNNAMTAVAASIVSGADVNEQGSQGDAPIHWAAFNGNSELVRSLLKAGADVNDQLDNGNTPLHLAAYKAHAAVIRVLLDNGADGTLRNRDGKTPLDLARRAEDQAAIDLLAGFSPRSQAPTAPSQPSRAKPLIAGQTPPQADSPETFRIQLVAVSSEERAQRALSDYGDRFADLLTREHLHVDKADRSTGPVYRVQYGPLSFTNAQALCAELKRREQPCLIKAAFTQ